MNCERVLIGRFTELYPKFGAVKNVIVEQERGKHCFIQRFNSRWYYLDLDRYDFNQIPQSLTISVYSETIDDFV